MLYFLILHGLVGAFDVVWNHELKERLPARAWAATEQRLHSARELLFATLFIGLAWWQWHGALAWLVAALVAAESGVTVRDVVVEVRTRVLSLTEQLSHVFLFVNLGVFLSLLFGELQGWRALPDAVVGVDHGWRSWLLTALGLLALLWSVRDGVSARALRKLPAQAPPAAACRADASMPSTKTDKGGRAGASAGPR